MKTRQRNLAIVICSLLMAVATFFGIASLSNSTVFASGTPTITMISGASVRKTEETPGIKFTARIDNFVAGGNYKYGMLILPKEAWDNLGWNENTNYHAYFAGEGITDYADKICSPYIDVETGDWCISYSLINLQSYTRSLVGVAYVFDGTNYTYTKVDMSENARSISYVAQMALKNETNLSVEQKNVLKSYANAGLSIEEEDVLTDSLFNKEGATEYVPTDYALKRTFNVSEEVSLITKTAYAGGSEVSFKYFIPAGTPTSWWGIAYSTSNTGLSIYAAADSTKSHSISKENTVTGEWKTVSFTLPAGGPYYLYFGSEVSSVNWKLNGENSYMLIDDFKVGNVTERFTDNLHDSIFNINAGAIESFVVSKQQVGFGGEPSEYSAKIIVDEINSDAGLATFVTKDSYPAGSVVKFKYYMPTDVKVGTWAKLCCVANANSSNIYENWILDLPITQGEWIEKEFALTSAGYLHFAADVGQWGSGAGYILIDDFTVTYNGTTVTETFNKGFANSLFNVNTEGAVELGEGYVVPEPEELGEVALKIILNGIDGNDDGVRARTTTAYAGGSTVSFKYFIQADTAVQWTRFIWDTDTNCDNYAETFTSFGNTAGEWVTWSYTLPAGGPYYLYFGFECGNWKDSSGAPYILIDDFTVNGEVETFNYGVENSIFTILQSNLAGNSEIGEGNKGDIVETPEYDKNSFALVDLVGLGKILDVLENKGGYAYVYGAEIETTDLPESMLFVSGNIKYTITDNKEFALSFDNGYFIFVDETRVAFYKNTQLLKTIAVSGNNEISFAIAANGSISISIANGGYVGLGVMDTAPTCANLVALGGKGSVDFDSFKVTNFKVVGEVLENVPQYVSSEAIDFTAYAFDSDNMVSDAGFKLLADAGFTKTLGLLQGRSPSDDLHEQDITGNKNCTCGSAEAHVENLMKEVNADAMAALALAEKYGLKHYVLNSNIYNIERNKNNYEWLDEFANKATYTNHKAFAGHFLADEPKHTAILTNTELEELVNAYKAYRAAFPEGEAFINLLPKTSTLLSSESTYNAYVDYYVNNIAKDKDGVKGTGYVSFDHYPLKDSEVTSSHLRNLELIAEKCRDNSLELRFYIKVSCAGDSTRELRASESKNDLMMQIYSGLVYGGKEVIYYQFTDHTKTDGTAGDGVVSGVSLEKTNVYNWAAEVNNEVHAFDAAYNNFKWVSASVFGTSITQTNNLKSKADVYGYISSVSTTGTALIGNFTDLDGKFTHGAQYAYMVMNYGDTGNNQDVDTITITFNGTPNRALVYENGLARVVTLSSNQLTLSLELGEGAFVIPLK